MTSTPHLYPVRLTDEQRERLEAISSKGRAPVRKVRAAQVLLLSDRNRPSGRLSRDQIAQALGMHVNSVDRIRKRFVLEGEEPVLERKPRATPPIPPKIDGHVEVCDNLNTHGIASLYEAFPAEQAHRLARRLEIHYTPRNGSWLNVAEIELAVLSQQCLDRRIGSAEELQQETAAWMQSRNAEACRLEWRFRTEDARLKLRHLYPQV